MTDPEQPKTVGTPPYRDYLTDGVTRLAALDMCEQVAQETPDLAAAYLRWLVTEVRTSGWAAEDQASKS